MVAAPAVSVVLPFRDAARWLPLTLAALTQEWAVPFELIAINDASRDGSAELLERLCRHWPRWRWRLLHGDGRGVSAARNAGLAVARAPLVAFLDADDRALPGRLSLPVEVMASRSELVHVHGGWWRVDAGGQPLQLVQPWLEGAGFSFRQALNHKAVLPSAWTLRREALEAVGGFDVELSHAEDVDLLLRLAAAGSTGAWLEKPLVRYRVHGSAASRSLAGQAQGLLTVVERHLPGVAPAEAAEFHYATLSWCVWQAWIEGDHAMANCLLERCGRHCPWPYSRRPVHLLEVFARSGARVGQPLDRQALLASPFWQRAVALLQP